MILGGVFSYVLLNFYPQMITLENGILLGMLRFFQIPSFYVDGFLSVGSFYNSSMITPTVFSQDLFFIFFLAFAAATSSMLRVRVRMLLFGLVSLPLFILSQFLIIIILSALGILSEQSFLHASLVVIGLVGGLVVEVSLFSTMTLPEKTKVPRVIKRSYFAEYIYYAIILVVSFLFLEFLLFVTNISEDSVVAAYLAINIITVFKMKSYVAYFFWELRIPEWVKARSPSASLNYVKPCSLSFLLPAYNERGTIRQCIESIDRAATKYSGKTEIIVVNDGSTDKTGDIASYAVLNLKHAIGKVFTIPNSGKGHALQYGLKQTSGEVIFRIDTDSVLDENAIQKIMTHFDDPVVGLVSGMLFPIEEKTISQKIMILFGCLFIFYRRGQELVDSILCQPGAFSVFRKSALIQSGGWATQQFGEDGEITVKIARMGYKIQFEQRAFVKSGAPSTLNGFRVQRLRWGIAFYQSCARNLEIIKEFRGPRTIAYSINMVMQGGGVTHSLFLPFLFVSIILQISQFSETSLTALAGILSQLAVIEVLLYGLQYILYVYFLIKFKRPQYIKYIPIMRFYQMFISMFVAPEALEILMSWSTRWKKHNNELHDGLRKKMMQRQKNAR